MKIIEQSHEIISLPENVLETIELAGRTCYKSEGKIGCMHPPENQKIESCEKDYMDCGADCKHHSSHKFVKMLLDKKHHAMIEFGDIVVKFITNRGVTHELVRHRLCSFAQESTRYVRYDGKMEFIRPVWVPEEFLGEFTEGYDFHRLPQIDALDWLFACIDAEISYLSLLSKGWRPEQAREVLPNSLKTEIVIKANIREWRHIFKLRHSKKAHPQMCALMYPLLKEVREKIPVVFDDL